MDFLLASLIAPLFLFCMVLILMYNDLVFLKQRCERNWANIQVSLKKRANLIPSLEQVVRQYLDHESDLQEDLVELRESSKAAVTSDEVDQYLEKEHSSIDMINVRLESYPDLKGADVVADMNRRLIKLENEIALIRAGFNDAVNQYRTRIQTFPDNLLAGLFRFEAMDVLRFDTRSHEIPDVRMNRDD
jgi:hypothetical protein